MVTLTSVELGVLGPLQVRMEGAPVVIPGAKPRAILTMLGLHSGSVVSADTLLELLWGDDPPRTAEKALQTHVSALRRTLGDGVVITEGTGWTLTGAEVDATRYKRAARTGRDAAAAGDTSAALARFEEATALWRGIPELPDTQRGVSEETRWIEGHAALAEDRADALLATGRAAEIIGDLEAAVADAPLRERRWGQLMLALYRAGRQGEALGAYRRARNLLAEQLGVDPGPDLRRLEAAIVSQDPALDIPAVQPFSTVTRAVTFLLTDIEGSTVAWEAEADAMAPALARHDELVEQVVTSRGGRLIKTRGEGDATFSVFDRPSAAAAAALELQDAIGHESWALTEPLRIRVALHTGEVELRDGDYFGRAVNRAARLRSLAAGGQILCSGATAELVIDSLPDDVVLADVGMRQLKNLARPEHVFELRLETADKSPPTHTADTPIERPDLPAVLTGPGPFVGRGGELAQILSAWQTALAEGTRAVLIAGEPGVGKTRLAGEWSSQAYQQGAVVLYGRCDEDLGAPYQPFAEALRTLVPCVGTTRIRGIRGVEALLPLVPALTDVLPDLAAPPRADPDTERYALFDAVVALLGVASASAPIVLILDDLHWAAKPTLLLLRHLLRFGEHARVQIVGTYRSTDLDRSHPLAAMLADLNRDGTASRIQLSGLGRDDVTSYVAQAGYDDEELARALTSVTGGNPFFLIEALRHVDESGGHWDPSTLPQGVREAVSRRLSRLPIETNKALAAAAVVGSRFAVDLVERVLDQDLVDAFDEACKAGIIIEEPGGRYRFNHALVRQSLLAELASVRRMRLHQRIATTLESQLGDDELLADLAHHYFECAWAGNAAKAVEYCRRAADQAMARLAYEGAADLYDHAVHALEELDDELPDRDDLRVELLVARCEALLAAGDVVSAAGAVSQLQDAAHDSPRLAAWATCFDGQLSMLVHPERLNEIEAAVGAAADRLAELDDAAGEAKAHTVRAAGLARLGRVGDCEVALDNALTAARRARDHRRVNQVLAGAPLAALWGPNPVPRAGGRCLDVVRLLRITTDSPAVEAISTRCQAVLEAFRGRGAAARRMIDSARRTAIELGLRHALLEVEQFAGVVELVLDDPAAAEPHLRQACNGFRRMGLDTDTAETAALLARACLALDRDGEADELCTESQHLAGHALKASISWRTVRAQLLARSGSHDEARRMAQEAVALAERTDGLADHGDACLALATVLDAAGDSEGARAAAERAVGLYEQKGAAALAEKARRVLGGGVAPASAPPEEPGVELDNACVRALRKLDAAVDRKALDAAEEMYAPDVFVESRRKIVGFTQSDLPSGDWPRAARSLRQGWASFRIAVVAVRGERLALIRIELGTDDLSPGAPQEQLLALCGLDEDGRMALQVFFDVEDIAAAMAELDATNARFEAQRRQPRLENAASRVEDQCYALFADGRPDEIGALLAVDHVNEDRRQGLRRESNDRAAAIANIRAIAALGANITNTPIALRGDLLCLSHILFEHPESQADAFMVETLELTEIDTNGIMVSRVVFDCDDYDAAIAELDARYLAGEAADHAHTWSVIGEVYAAFNRRELAATTPDWVNIDHRRAASFAPGDMIAYIQAAWDDSPDTKIHIAAVHRLNSFGAVVSHVAHGISQDGFEAEWRDIHVLAVSGDALCRSELFDGADLDTALARFDELSRPVRRLENAASRVTDRFLERFAARDWDAMAQVVIDDIRFDDRRRVVNADLQIGRDKFIENFRTAADLGATQTLNPIATRGDRVVLTRARFARGEGNSEEFGLDLLHVIEIDPDHRIAATVTFDPEDLDAAFAELDARYLAGEGADHARTWSVIAQNYASLNRQQMPATTSDWVSVDHRRATMVAPGEMLSFTAAAWDVVPDMRRFIATVHRLSDLGAVVTHTAQGVSRAGFSAEWQAVVLMTVDDVLVNRTEIFDEDDLDAALARFDELSRPVRRLENAASQAEERFWRYFAVRDWDAMAEALTDGLPLDDRRKAVNAGIRQGRDAEIENVKAMAEVGTTNVAPRVLATRGTRLALNHCVLAGPDQRPEAFRTELLAVVETDTNNRVAARVLFDLDDLDAAFAELDARYLAREAAAHAHTWSVIARTFAAANRHEPLPTTADWVNIDHHRGIAIEPGGLDAYIRSAWDEMPAGRTYVEAVHRLSNLGVVITHIAEGTTPEGFQAEWRGIDIMMVEGELISRSELFDEDDLETALSRFDELNRLALRPDNAASRVYQRWQACVGTHDWDAIAEILAADMSTDDRRRVVNTGIRHGVDAVMAENLGLAEFVKTITSEIVATRGARLLLNLVRGEGYEEFQAEFFAVVEIDADERIKAAVLFDPDDIDAAFDELESRYLAGEAAAHARTWSLLTRTYARLNRHELPATTPDWVNIDHRRAASFAPGEVFAYLGATWELMPDYGVHIATVHRLSDVAAVVTHAAHGSSQDGFAAEWRLIAFFTTDGELINRYEIFDEADLEAALARFDELRRQPRLPENTASRMYQRFSGYLETRDWEAMVDMAADDTCTDDRRRVVSGGVQRGRDAWIANLRSILDVGVRKHESVVIATRGERLALTRVRVAGGGRQPEVFYQEMLSIVELDTTNRFTGAVLFDEDDLDTALAELDTRYLAGEAGAHAHTWSVITGAYAALNRHEAPRTTPHLATADHRRLATFDGGDLSAYLGASWDLIPDIAVRIETVHALSNLGAVVTQVSHGTSQGGFAGEWRMIAIATVDGDLISGGEIFDENDLDAALVRFQDLALPSR